MLLLLILRSQLALPHDVVALFKCLAVEVLLQHRLHSFLVARLRFGQTGVWPRGAGGSCAESGTRTKAAAS